LLGIGCDVIVECAACGSPNGLSAHDRQNALCRTCQQTVSFPDISGSEVKVCFECLRSGNAAITKDTELGMISFDEAVAGITHGIPGLKRNDFELVAKEEGWVGARLPEEVMFELLRTPTYPTWQGEQWQFCCRGPMVFVGVWDRDEFAKRAPDKDGQRFFEETVQDLTPGFWENGFDDGIGIYVFRCPSCARFRAHWDID